MSALMTKSHADTVDSPFPLCFINSSFTLVVLLSYFTHDSFQTPTQMWNLSGVSMTTAVNKQSHVLRSL